jgi:glucose-6-phosphate isomerase
LYLFLVPASRRDLVLPGTSWESLEEISYLGGKTMGSMLYQEALSTASALARKGRPVLWLEVPVIDAFHLGGLVFFFEYVTALTGLSLGLNPFDQPGVEQGKRFTYGLMGRSSYESDADEARIQFRSIMADSAGL